ncbi:phage holin family protein [Methylophilus aquaticus]|uniref:phage holin family protein n=1 Tax=Methylophilus aquaticus TaxID=1971610 RepID=UPI0027955E81|nr:phage holin family protein [Methylophilus aquaticus]
MRSQVADYAEDRGELLKQDFMAEIERMATSVIGVLVVFSMFIFTGLLGLMWLFSLLWEHPHRTLILGLAMLLPTLIGIVIFFAVRGLWKQKPLFASSLELIGQDWQLFRNELAPKTDASADTEASEAATTAPRNGAHGTETSTPT